MLWHAPLRSRQDNTLHLDLPKMHRTSQRPKVFLYFNIRVISVGHFLRSVPEPNPLRDILDLKISTSVWCLLGSSGFNQGYGSLVELGSCLMSLFISCILLNIRLDVPSEVSL